MLSSLEVLIVLWWMGIELIDQMLVFPCFFHELSVLVVL